MGKQVKQLYLIGGDRKRLDFPFAPIDDLTASRFLVCYDEITEWAQRKSIVVMSNRDSQCIDTGFIATGKRQWGNNYGTKNEDEDDFLNTQGEDSPIKTQPNLNFAQQPSPVHLSISASRREEKQPLCASIEKKSDRTAIHDEEFSVSAAVKTFEQLQGFSTGDFVIASTIFINSAGVREVFLSCNEENKAPWIKAMIDQHKAKQKRPREELEQDANQNQRQSKLVRRISSMEIGRKRQWEELDQDANQNQPQSKLVRPISSMENQPQSCQMRVGMIRIFKARSALRFAFIMIGISKCQYDIEEAVPALQTQQLHIEELPTHKLIFANQVTQPLYTCKNITDKNEKPIEIQLIDINTGRQCTNVEGFNIKVKIVVIDGDLELEGLDSDKFNSKIVKQREGKGPLLIGNTEVTFNQQGVGTIGKIRFTDNSKWLRSRKFRLGACIDSKSCGTIIKIQEGLSEKFEVKDQRGLSYEKHYPPMLKLNDDVWRLENIAKDGKYHQRLKDNNINSVQDFLKFWNENPSRLYEEILKMPTNTYKNVVKHAQMCPMELDNSNFENNADLPKSPGLESFPLPNPMPEFQTENMEPSMIQMNGVLSAGHAKSFASGQDTNVLNSGVISRNDPLLNVPVPNAGMLHTPESQTQCWFTSVGMEPSMIQMNGVISAGHAKSFASGQDTNVLNSGVISRNDPLLNVPVPNAGMLHTPESQTQCWFTSVGMEPSMIQMNGVLSAGHAKSFASGHDTNVLNSGVISRNDPLLNVPVPDAGMLHTPESQTQCWFTSVGMEPSMIQMNGVLSAGHAKSFASGQDTNVLNSGVISRNDPLLNVPVPDAGMLHTPESQTQCWFTSVGMEPSMIQMNGVLSAGHAKSFASGQDTNVLNSGVISRNDPLLNVPVPNAGMLHTPESQTQCWFTSVGMEQGMIEMNGELSAGHAKTFASVPNAGMLHALESQAQCWYTSIGMDMGQQMETAACFGSDHSNPISSLNGNNGSLGAPEVGQAYQPYPAHITQEAPEDCNTSFTYEELVPLSVPPTRANDHESGGSHSLDYMDVAEEYLLGMPTHPDC